VLLALFIVVGWITGNSASVLALIPPIVVGIMLVLYFFASAIDGQVKPIPRWVMTVFCLSLLLFLPGLCLHITDEAGYVFVHSDGKVTSSTWMLPWVAHKEAIPYFTTVESEEAEHTIEVYLRVYPTPGDEAIRAYEHLGKGNIYAQTSVERTLSGFTPDTSARKLHDLIRLELSKREMDAYIEWVIVEIEYSPPR